MLPGRRRAVGLCAKGKRLGCKSPINAPMEFHRYATHWGQLPKSSCTLTAPQLSHPYTSMSARRACNTGPGDQRPCSPTAAPWLTQLLWGVVLAVSRKTTLAEANAPARESKSFSAPAPVHQNGALTPCVTAHMPAPFVFLPTEAPPILFLSLLGQDLANAETTPHILSSAPSPAPKKPMRPINKSPKHRATPHDWSCRVICSPQRDI